MINCPTCQTPNRAEARFCMGCGAKLAVDPPVTAAPEFVAPTLAPADDAALPEEASTSPVEALPPVLPAAEETPAPPMDALQEPAPAVVDLPAETLQQPEPAGDEQATSLAAPVALAGETDAVPSAPDAAPTLAPLAAGAVIGGRFTVVALQQDEASDRIYSATDSRTCSQCGVLMEPGDRFCGNCGVEVTGPAVVRLQETAEAPEGPATEAGGRWYEVLPAEAQTLPPGQTDTGWRLQVGQASDNGRVRELDEDSVFSLVMSGIYESQIETTVGLFIVADGIGGHDGGEVASKLAVQTIAQQVLQDVIWPILRGETLLVETLRDYLEQAVQTANRLIFELSRERSSDMGTTLTMALVINGLAIIGSVGDSRTYVWGPAGLEQVTEDHSLIAALIAAGQEPPEAIYTHPQRNLITRSLGDRPQVEVDLFAQQLEPGFKLVLCCDGVWEMIYDKGIEDILLQEDNPQRVADKIVEWSNNAGGEDNISVIIVAVERP